jgi:hypothetical protein
MLGQCKSAIKNELKAASATKSPSISNFDLAIIRHSRRDQCTGEGKGNNSTCCARCEGGS